MKVEPKNLQEKIIGAEKEMTFEIDTDNHIIFEILRDKMYSDKIGAVTREVSSNSRDANREAGREDVPVVIEIVKPNKFASISHTTIVFHDNGIGITPDRMSDVFIKYASSTKRDSNKETGGFGLGAKTPFAYSDTFTVITVCDWEGKRMKYMYNAIIDSTNKGKMILFESEETDEETGTQIVVPIKNDEDRAKFEKKAIYATQYWGDGIVYKGFERERPEFETVIDEPEFSVIKKYSEQNYALLIDGIHYPLDKNQVGINDNGISNEYTILLKFGTGELTISANRESVQYDEDTNAAIKARQEHIKDRISTLANEYVATLPSYFEACKFAFYMFTANQDDRRDLEDELLTVITESFNGNRGYYKTKKILSEERSRFKDIKFNGLELIPSYRFKEHDVCLVREPRYDNKTRYDSFRKLNITDNLSKYPIYYGDARKDSRRNATIFDDNDAFYLIIPAPHGDATAQLDEMNEFTNILDLSFNMYSDVEKKKKESTASTGGTSDKERVTLNIKTLDYSDLRSHRLVMKRKTAEIDDIAGYGALNSEDDLIYYTVSALSDLWLSYEEKQNIKSLQKITGKKVIFVNISTTKNWMEKSNIESYQDAKARVEKQYMARWIERTKMNMIGSALEESMERGWSYFKAVHEVLTPLMPKCVHDYIAFHENNSADDLKKEPFIAQEIKFDEEGLVKKIEGIFENKYPLLLPYLEEKLGWRNKTPQPRIIMNVEKYIKSV